MDGLDSRVGHGWVRAVVATVIAASATCARADAPLAWPVAFHESYLLRPHEGTQLRLEPDGMTVRRFHLRVESERPIEVEVRRRYESLLLWSERRTSRATAVIPWGRGEYGEVDLFNPMDEAVRVDVAIATDPDEEGLPVASFHVNRFLESYEDGDVDDAMRELDRALAQDPADSTALRLMGRLTGTAGSADEIIEVRRVRRLENRVERWRREGDDDEIDDLLAAPPDFETVPGRFRWLMLRASIHAARGETMRALQIDYEALDVAPDRDARFEVYPRIVAANLALGNRAQAEAVIERALNEAPADAMRRRVRSWIEPD